MQALTDVLDLLGLLLLVAAAVLWLAPVTVPGAVALAGVGVLGVSWVAERRRRR